MEDAEKQAILDEMVALSNANPMRQPGDFTRQEYIAALKATGRHLSDNKAREELNRRIKEGLLLSEMRKDTEGNVRCVWWRAKTGE